jgi:hypothetical protein
MSAFAEAENVAPSNDNEVINANNPLDLCFISLAYLSVITFRRNFFLGSTHLTVQGFTNGGSALAQWQRQMERELCSNADDQG